MEYDPASIRSPVTARLRAARVSETQLRNVLQGPDQYNLQNWVFLVDDGGERLAISAESVGSAPRHPDYPDEPLEDIGNSVVVARGDPFVDGSLEALVPYKLLRWDDVNMLTYEDASGGTQRYEGLADHWHIFSGGYHWVAVSLIANKEGKGVYLLQFTLADTGEPDIIRQGLVFSPTAEDYYEWGDNHRLKNPTNDLFLVGTNDGVAIGLRQNTEQPAEGGSPEPDKGHLVLEVVRAGWDFEVRRRRRVVGNSFGLVPPSIGTELRFSPFQAGTGQDPLRTTWSHENGASCTGATVYGQSLAPPERRYRLLAPDAITVHTPSDIQLILLNEDWVPLHREVVVETDGEKAYSMPTATVITSLGQRSVVGSTGEGRALVWKRVHTPFSSDQDDLWDFSDYGELSMRVYGPAGGYTENHITPVGWKANRPHILYWKGHLLVAWDGGPWSLVEDGEGGFVTETQTGPGGEQNVVYKLAWQKGSRVTVYALTLG